MAERYDFYVHDNRKITFNLTEPIMREDSGVTDFVFHIPKILNELEVSDWSWWLVFVNAKNEKYSIALTLSDDPESPLEKNVATYTVDYAMSIKAGSVQFALEAINTGTGGAIDNEWHTLTYETKVKETLQGNQAEYAETESDIISALLEEVRTKMNQVIGGATPIPVASVSAMTDPSKLYLLTTDGNWYYHNGTQFVSGGVYGAGVVDSVPTQGSTNTVSSGGVYDALHNTDTTLTQSGQAADSASVGYLFEKTENIFDSSDFLSHGWGRNGNEVYGTLSALYNVKFLDNYAFESNTEYTLSFDAYTEGNKSSGSENGLKVQIFYTDASKSFVTVKNNVSEYAFTAITSDGLKTIDYIDIYYSNAGDNIWHIRNIMLSKGSQIIPFKVYRTGIDSVARNGLSELPHAVKKIAPSVVEQHVWDDLDEYQVSNGWVLDGLGTSKRDTNGQLVKYAVQEGQILWLNIDKYTDAGVYQFQKSSSVSGIGSANPQLVGLPCVDAVNDVVTVPFGATYLVVTRSVNSPADSVKIAQFSRSLPSYWGTYIDAKAKELSRIASPPVGNGTRFIFITDVHLRNADGTFRNAGYSPLLMQYLHEHCNIGHAFFGGDTLTGSYASLNDAMDDLMLFRNTFSPVWDWMYSVFGNHEYGNNSSSLSAMDKSIIYNALIRDKERDYATVNPVYGSYVLDNKSEKIRFICLNLNEGNNLTQQNDFFCTAMEETPAGWTIVFITHFSLEDDNGTAKISTKLTNTNSIVPAIEAYNARQVYGTYDFTTAGAEVACVIGGHTHWDGMVKTSGGVPVIATTCDMHTGISGMTKGTVTEQAFDVFTIDTITKTISIKRIGYGADRNYTYGS